MLTNTSSLWVQAMTQKYLRKTSFLAYKRKPSDSPVWKNLLNCRSLLKKCIIWKVGNGENISFWTDNWIENKSLIEILQIDPETIPSPLAKVSEFIQTDKTWNYAKLNTLLNNHPVISKIQGIAIPLNSTPDAFCWGLDSSGNFSTKTATWLAHDKDINDISEWPLKWI